MITTIACLMLATAALAENGHYSYQGATVPMDHYEDVQNRDFPSLVFNFEQLRRDQPPQVEVREEDLGRYMYRPRTTTMPPPPNMRVGDIPAHVPEIKISPEPIYSRVPEGSTKKTIFGPQIFNKHLPATMPPPPAALQWMDLTDTIKHRGVNKPHYNPVQVPQAPMLHQEALSQTHAAPTAYPQYSGVMNTEPLPQSAYPQYSGVMNTEYVSTTQAPYAHYLQNVPEQHAMHSAPRASAQPSRGHHKFNWNDVTPTEARQPMVTTPASVPEPPPARRMNAPSSIPTLTPWAGDSFGK